MKKFRRNLLLVMILVAVTMLFAACAVGDGRVLGSNEEIITGYIRDIDLENRTITIDEVELIGHDNQRMINQLALDPARDFSYGYYSHHTALNDGHSLKLAQNCTFHIGEYDYGVDAASRSLTNSNLSRQNQAIDNSLGSAVTPGPTAYDQSAVRGTTTENEHLTDNNMLHNIKENLTNDMMTYRSSDSLYEFNSRFSKASHIPYRITIVDNLVTQIDERVLY